MKRRAIGQQVPAPQPQVVVQNLKRLSKCGCLKKKGTK